MISVIYISRATAPLRSADLDEILRTSRHQNSHRGVTGMLVYMDGGFIQALEGEQDVVDALVTRIAADSRHRDLVVIARYPISARQFPGWSMGFRRCDGAPPKELADAFVNIRKPIFKPGSATADSIAHKLIEGFRLRSRG